MDANRFQERRGRHQMLVEREVIRELARRIGREFDPERVVLFGSYA